MRKTIILLTLVLMFNFINVLADIPPLPREPTPKPIKEEKPYQPTPIKEEKQQQGLCFAPIIVAGTLLSLSFFAFGLRFMRHHQTQWRVKEING